MPGCHFGSFWEIDPHRWERCREEAATQMLAEGWILKSKKFGEVQMKRARKLWTKK